MYLKRLEMQGFKSFVDKTVLEFDKGITAVVGPNGSGKSNISDAVKWVLGEQSPKTLRGSRMEDMIFAGTQNRKPVGMAEVSLIMDNEDHTLNIDFLEVRITRRLYRSGESEYLINGAQCRLKDILMLFADTGIGRDGYSIIGQGRIDEILNNKSEDRRGIFEDASGIMKYRMRKVESERKLAATEQNLLRINDIVRELESQIKPLAKQSEAARKFLSLKYELRDIEVKFLTEAIDKADLDLTDILQKLEIVSGDRELKEAGLVEIQSENQEKTELSRVYTEKLEAAKNLQHELEKQAERLRGEIAINNEKIQSAVSGKAIADSELTGQKARIEAITADIKRSEAEIQSIQGEIDALEAEGGDKADKLIEAGNNVSEAEKAAEDIKASIVSMQLEAGELEAKASSNEKQIEHFTERKNELDKELKILDETDSAGAGELTKAENDYRESADAASDAKQEYQNNAERLAIIRAKSDDISRKINEITGKMRSYEAQRNLLKEMEEGFEGYARSVKEVLQMCKKNTSFGDGIYGAVAQLFTVSGEYELAVETALGQSYQNIVTESEEETKAAIEYLKEHKYGRATFMPLTAVNGRKFEDQLQKELSFLPGYLGIASDKVSCDSKFRPVADSLLGRVAVFKTLDAAISAARAHKYGFMCVTLEGDILRTSGAITGGAQERGQKTVGALSRTREIPKLEKALAESGKEVEKLMKELNDAKNEATGLDERQKQAFEGMKELEAKVSELSSRCAALKERQQGRVNRRSQLLGELKSQIVFVQNSRSEIEAARESAEEIKSRIAETELALMGKMSELETLKASRDSAAQDVFGLKLKEKELTGRLDKEKSDILRFNSDIETARQRMEYYESQKGDSDSAVKALEEDNAKLEEQVRAVVEKTDAARNEAQTISDEKAQVDESLGGMLTRITEMNADITRLNEEGGRLEIQKVRAENEINSSKNRLWEEYELTYTAAKEMADNITIDNYKEAQKKINDLRSAIKALGPVNVNAVEEYETTLARYEFMSAQSKDMNESKEKLEKVIRELTAVMKTQFMEQFQIIRKNFSEVFSELFGGGKADIVLADSDDVLECGIDINVQPPGKKLQNMMLLSGGERALTAIALLFGILRMRPSPFCLLDEIEAALDDANVYRLSDYLDNVSKNTQFIMVTHRKGTMENAESLYGVTMEEKGISKVVSLKLK